MGKSIFFKCLNIFSLDIYSTSVTSPSRELYRLRFDYQDRVEEIQLNDTETTARQKEKQKIRWEGVKKQITLTENGLRQET